MKLDFEFKESNQSFGLDFNESDQQIDTDFGEVYQLGGVVEEVDPTVPDWAKQPEKPTYTADEIIGSVKVDPTLTVEGAAADAKAVGDALEIAYKTLSSSTTLGFYCIEDVTIVTNGVSKTYPANSNVEVSFVEGDVFEIIPTSNNSILALTSFPGALGTFYPWLEGVKQFSNILFDMNTEEMYTKWNQGNQVHIKYNTHSIQIVFFGVTFLIYMMSLKEQIIHYTIQHNCHYVIQTFQIIHLKPFI